MTAILGLKLDIRMPFWTLCLAYMTCSALISGIGRPSWALPYVGNRITIIGFILGPKLDIRVPFWALSLAYTTISGLIWGIGTPSWAIY